MHSPVIVTYPSALPVSVEEAKLACRIDADDEDDLVDGLIVAATAHIEMIINKAIAEQVWRQDFDAFDDTLRLPKKPVLAIESVTWKDAAGDEEEVDEDDYDLLSDEDGWYVRFVDDFDDPTDLYETAAVSVTFKAGYEPLPAPIRQAILLLVGFFYKHREAANDTSLVELPIGVDRLIASYREIVV